MERKIIIADSAANSKVTITTSATTFGELKEAARAAGVNFTGKDWLEGLTKTSPMSDDSLLPTEVEYKGKKTNNLVYLLSNTNKKVKSGFDRKELYAKVKEYNLQETIKKANGGKNFTQCGNDILAAAVAKYEKTLGTSAKPEFHDVEKNGIAVDNTPVATAEPAAEETSYKEKYEELVFGIASLLSVLSEETKQDIAKELDKIIETAEEEEVVDVDFSDDEIKSMFKK